MSLIIWVKYKIETNILPVNIILKHNSTYNRRKHLSSDNYPDTTTARIKNS